MEKSSRSHRVTELFTTGQLLLRHRFMLQKHPCTDDFQHIRAAVDWLIRAQESTPDHGISKGFALNKGWLPSYVETTGYIIPTMFECWHRFGLPECRTRALQMAEWELANQFSNGAFPGCQIETGGKPLAFDTGMVIFGLIRAYEETKDRQFKTAAQKAGDWLLHIQERSGEWNAFTLNNQPRAYHSRISWALLELFFVTQEEKYRNGAIKNLNWVLDQQLANGWFRNNSFYGENSSITHTIAYAARGLLESGILLDDHRYIRAANKTAISLSRLLQRNGSLPGSFDDHWGSKAGFVCLSGNAQVAILWVKLYRLTRDTSFFHAASRTIAFLKMRQDLTTQSNAIHGGISSTHPIFRGYLKFFYSSWAVKFFIDLLLEYKGLRPTTKDRQTHA